MCVYFRIGFIDFMLKGKSLSGYTNSFSPNEYKNNIKIFSIEPAQVKIMKIYCNVCHKYRKSKKTKKLYILKKALSLSIA